MSFKNTLVLLTSNIGSRVIAASSGGLSAFGSRRSLMGGGDEADEAISKAEQVRIQQCGDTLTAGFVDIALFGSWLGCWAHHHLL